jgi:hypothetical protein
MNQVSTIGLDLAKKLFQVHPWARQSIARWLDRRVEPMLPG